MKYIDLDFIPFKINRKFSIAKIEIDCSKKIKLFEKYYATISIARNLFNKVNVIFTLDENVDEIDNLLISKYGEPEFIVNNGLKMWKVKGVYIEHGEVEDRVQCVYKHIISICLFKDGFTVKSERYITINQIFDKVALNWKLKKKVV